MLASPNYIGRGEGGGWGWLTHHKAVGSKWILGGAGNSRNLGGFGGRHRHTGLDILGDEHESARLALKARKPLEEAGACSLGKF